MNLYSEKIPNLYERRLSEKISELEAIATDHFNPQTSCKLIQTADFAEIEEMVDICIKIDLKERLRINENQHHIWSQLLISSESNSRATIDSIDLRKLTAADLIERISNGEKLYEEHVRKLLAALSMFYATLTVDQQKLLDEYIHVNNRMRYLLWMNQ